MRAGILSLLICVLSSCGPIKAYPGNELPLSQVAVVTTSCMGESSLHHLRLDGTEFCFRDIAVLPGTHRFEVGREDRSAPFDCYTRDEFDSSGYASCRDDREEDIRKDRSPRDCYESDYHHDVTYCTVTHTYYRCTLDTGLDAGKTYEVGTFSYGDTVKLRRKGEYEPCGIFDCLYSSTEDKFEKQ